MPQNFERVLLTDGPLCHCVPVCNSRLDTDMLLAGRCGLHSLFVLTGCSTLKDVDTKRSSAVEDERKQVPDFYVPSLADLSSLLG